MKRKKKTTLHFVRNKRTIFRGIFRFHIFRERTKKKMNERDEMDLYLKGLILNNKPDANLIMFHSNQHNMNAKHRNCSGLVHSIRFCSMPFSMFFLFLFASLLRFFRVFSFIFFLVHESSAVFFFLFCFVVVAAFISTVAFLNACDTVSMLYYISLHWKKYTKYIMVSLLVCF